MIPRFFVSSTYYDLKHVRERLEKFIENYGFQPILFESDRVTYQHGKPIDESAYFEVGLCHVMVLLIGGRYGSSSSQERILEERKLYDENYISITRKEFETAILKNIPIMIFIDKNVYAEYETYKENQAFLDDDMLVSANGGNFKFAHVDHINVFKFIDTVKSKPIKTFEKVEEIENYLKSQLAGMFYLYLESLKQSSEEKKILDTISELNNVTLRMNEMINSVGKEILGGNEKEYLTVINNQFEILVNFFMKRFSSEVDFANQYESDDLKEIDFESVAVIFYEKVLTSEIPKVNSGVSPNLYSKEFDKITVQLFDDLQDKLYEISDKLEISRLFIRTLNREFRNNVLPFIKGISDKNKIIDRLKNTLLFMLDEAPF